MSDKPHFIVPLPVAWDDSCEGLDQALDALERQVRALRWERWAGRVVGLWGPDIERVRFRYSGTNGLFCEVPVPKRLDEVYNPALGDPPTKYAEHRARMAAEKNSFEMDVSKPFQEKCRALLLAESFPQGWVVQALGDGTTWFTRESFQGHTRECINALVGNERRASLLAHGLPTAAPGKGSVPRF